LCVDFDEFKNSLEDNPNPLLELQGDAADQQLLEALYDREDQFLKWLNITEFLLGKINDCILRCAISSDLSVLLVYSSLINLLINWYS
jgi:hypothetical protein